LSPTLLQRATELSEDLARLRGLQLVTDAGSVIAERARELRATRERLESPIAFLRAVRADPELHRHGVEGLDVSNSLAAVEKAHAIARNDPEAIVKGTVLASALSAVKEATRSAEAAAEVVWRRIAATAPTVQAELLEVLGRMPSYRKTVERLRAMDRQINELAVLRWVSAVQLDTFMTLQRQARTEWQRLAGTDALPPIVLDFLVACAHDGSTLDSMTPEVEEWIRERGLRSVFRIRFAGG